MYATLIPNAEAAEITIEQKGLTLASDAVGIDLAKYAIISQKYQPDFYMDIIPQENIRYRLESDTSKIDMLYTFANGNLRMIHVLETEGIPNIAPANRLVSVPYHGYLLASKLLFCVF